jgi:hypothetical protein
VVAEELTANDTQTETEVRAVSPSLPLPEIPSGELDFNVDVIAQSSEEYVSSILDYVLRPTPSVE